MGKKNLNLRYGIHQVLFWSSYAGMASFAATYLQEKGMEVSSVGIVLFAASVLSFVIQLMLADFADRQAKNGNSIIKITVSLALISLAGMVIVRFADLPLGPFAAIYVVMLATFDMEIPMMNSICVKYNSSGYKISFEPCRGAGAVMYGVACTLIGYAMRDWGPEWMPNISIILIALFVVTSITYPRLSADGINVGENDVAIQKDAGASLSISEFAVKYKWYMVSLIGIVLFAFAHISSENFLIEIFKGVGGDSSNVGVALLIACAVEAPGTLAVGWAFKKFGDRNMWVVCGITYMIKMLIFLFGGSIMMIYVGQLMQLTTYTIIPPGQVIYARHCVGDEDMVKGQSTTTAAYVLGGAGGNLAGGFLTGTLGVPSLLILDAVLAVIGAAIMFITVPKALQKKNI